MILLINREPLGGKGLTGPIWQFLFFKPLPRRLAKTSPFVILPYCNARWFCSSTESLSISGLIIIILLLLSAHLSSLSLVYTGTCTCLYCTCTHKNHNNCRQCYPWLLVILNDNNVSNCWENQRAVEIKAWWQVH